MFTPILCPCSQSLSAPQLALRDRGAEIEHVDHDTGGDLDPPALATLRQRRRPGFPSSVLFNSAWISSHDQVRFHTAVGLIVRLI